jgi:hypothetical protein
MEQRQCKVCGISQDIEKFAFAGNVNGKDYYRHKCKKCYQEMKSNRVDSLRHKFKEYKKTLKCSRCEVEDYRVLQFHHHDSNKEFNVSEGITRGLSFERTIKEAEKCEVLCANCHSILHYEERNK